MPALSLDHIHIYAADPAATLAFYLDVLGADPLGSIPSGGGDRRNHFVIVGGQVLAVSGFPAGMAAVEVPAVGDGATHTGYGVAHIGLNVTDIDEQVSRLRAAGVVPHSEPRRSGPLRYVYFTGPDGVIFELTQYDLPRRFTPAVKALNGLNRTIHRVRRRVTSTLLSLAPTG